MFRSPSLALIHVRLLAVFHHTECAVQTRPAPATSTAIPHLTQGSGAIPFSPATASSPATRWAAELPSAPGPGSAARCWLRPSCPASACKGEALSGPESRRPPPPGEPAEGGTAIRAVGLVKPLRPGPAPSGDGVERAIPQRGGAGSSAPTAPGRSTSPRASSAGCWQPSPGTGIVRSWGDPAATVLSVTGRRGTAASCPRTPALPPEQPGPLRPHLARPSPQGEGRDGTGRGRQGTGEGTGEQGARPWWEAGNQEEEGPGGRTPTEEPVWPGAFRLQRGLHRPPGGEILRAADPHQPGAQKTHPHVQQLHPGNEGEGKATVVVSSHRHPEDSSSVWTTQAILNSHTESWPPGTSTSFGRPPNTQSVVALTRFTKRSEAFGKNKCQPGGVTCALGRPGAPREMVSPGQGRRRPRAGEGGAPAVLKVRSSTPSASVGGGTRGHGLGRAGPPHSHPARVRRAPEAPTSPSRAPRPRGRSLVVRTMTEAAHPGDPVSTSKSLHLFPSPRPHRHERHRSRDRRGDRGRGPARPGRRARPSSLPLPQQAPGMGRLPSSDADVTGQGSTPSAPSVRISSSTWAPGSSNRRLRCLACLERVHPEITALNAGSLDYLSSARAVRRPGPRYSSTTRWTRWRGSPPPSSSAAWSQSAVLRHQHPPQHGPLRPSGPGPETAPRVPGDRRRQQDGRERRLAAAGPRQMVPGTHSAGRRHRAAKEVSELHRKTAELGGDLRTGLEDTSTSPRGEGIVQRRAGGGPGQVARDAGREIAGPEETRRILGLRAA